MTKGASYCCSLYTLFGALIPESFSHVGEVIGKECTQKLRFSACDLRHWKSPHSCGIRADGALIGSILVVLNFLVPFVMVGKGLFLDFGKAMQNTSRRFKKSILHAKVPDCFHHDAHSFFMLWIKFVATSITARLVDIMCLKHG